VIGTFDGTRFSCGMTWVASRIWMRVLVVQRVRLLGCHHRPFCGSDRRRSSSIMHNGNLMDRGVPVSNKPREDLLLCGEHLLLVHSEIH
jgi:hypothetical protein